MKGLCLWSELLAFDLIGTCVLGCPAVALIANICGLLTVCHHSGEPWARHHMGPSDCEGLFSSSYPGGRAGIKSHDLEGLISGTAGM